ncbi:MAG: hypothetical protein ACI8TP_003469 [Acidimicrobiales bacterium]|jgi:uncharacterized protein YcaQ
MSVLQLDSVNVLCRSHFMPMFSRLGGYDRDRLDHWLWSSGENLEFLAHEASITAIDLQPLLRFRARSGRWKMGREFEKKEPEYLAAVLREVDELGPLSVSDLSDPGDRTGPWWGYSKGKLALEWLYVTGRLSIRERTKTFLTIYDLPERVVPDEVRARPELADDEAFKELLLLGAASHGVGTATDIADYFRLKMPVARPLLAELVEEGRLELVDVEGWGTPAYLHPEAKRPRRIGAATLLSPFDPVVWFRPRAERFFNFEYRIEIYVPEPKRTYGYYVLPFLLGDQLVGRVDLKADRKAGRLLARGAFHEPGADPQEIAGPLATNLHELAAFLGLDGVEVGQRGNLAAALRTSV